MSEIKLQAGQWYRTRGGSIVYALAVSEKHDAYLIESNSLPYYCKGNGKHFFDNRQWDIVEHLPDCTGFDWVPKPKLQLREGAWYERSDKRVVGPCNSTGIDDRPWAVGGYFYRHDGKNGGHEDVHLIREVDPPKLPEPKYRAFKGKDEFYSYRDNWIVRKGAAKDRESVCKILSFSDAGCTVSTCSLHAIKTWEEMLNDWNFDDGTPFGVLDGV